MQTNLSSLEFCLRRSLVLVVSGVEVGKRGLVRLTNILELLDVAPCRREVHLSNLERRANKGF